MLFGTALLNFILGVNNEKIIMFAEDLLAKHMGELRTSLFTKNMVAKFHTDFHWLF